MHVITKWDKEVTFSRQVSTLSLNPKLTFDAREDSQYISKYLPLMQFDFPFFERDFFFLNLDMVFKLIVAKFNMTLIKTVKSCLLNYSTFDRNFSYL